MSDAGSSNVIACRFFGVTAVTSRHTEQDILVLLLSIAADMRVAEIAQIKVQVVRSHPVRFAKKLRANHLVGL
jgi:DNA-binding CsgD family transcriptional regulator